MAPRPSLAVATIAVAIALGAAGRLPDPAPGPVTAIDTARTSIRSGDRAARATERVRYDDAALTLVATYPIVDGAPVADATLPARDHEVWGLVGATLPPAAVATIRQLNVVTDGRDGTLAMVHRSTVDDAEWVLSIDPAETDETLVGTLVHEYAHMLTLRPADLASRAASRDGCDGVRIALGCAHPGSALAAWADAFWPGVAEPAETDHRAFVTEYASSSVHEDLAETFMCWVLDDVARPSATVRAKFAFFADRPEFVTARDEIRERLGR